MCGLNLSKWRSLVLLYGVGGDAKEVIRGCLEGFHQGIPDHTEEVFKKIGFFRSSPMGSVINGDGSFRIINDLSFPHGDADTPLALFDWEKVYRQIPIHPSQWRYLFLLDLLNRLWLDSRIQFGGVAGCGVFGRPADHSRYRKIKFRYGGCVESTRKV